MAHEKGTLKTIAFDLGCVIVSESNDIFSSNYLETELTDGIYDVLSALETMDHVKLIVISKAYPKNAKRSREILKMYGIEDKFNSIIFCEHNDWKADIAKAMRVNVMIDDKQQILDLFPKDIKTILFRTTEVSSLLGRILNCI